MSIMVRYFDDRRVAYTALKEGVESGQESNEKLEEDLILRYGAGL
jgi:hypothetical protein